MATEFTIFDWINSITQIIIIPIMVFIYSRKIHSEKQLTGNWNTIKLIILTAFLIDLFSVAVEDLLFMLDIIPMQYYAADMVIALNRMSTGTLVMLGLCFIFYLLNWRTLIYFPLYFFIGIISYWLITGNDILYTIFCNVGGLFGVFSLLYVAIKIKDDGPLGLGIMYLLALISIAMEAIAPLDAIGVPVLITTGEFIFGLFFVIGYFRPFAKIQ
jgi:hypothetical protein